MNNKIINISLQVLIIIAASLIMSCNKDDTSTGNAIEINTIEELEEIITSCSGSEFQTKEEIENNLIGEWKLLGIRSGWVNQFEKSNITLKINDELIVLNDNDTGEIFETTWKLSFIEVNTYQYYYLETSEDGFNNSRLGMQTFCEKFMYGTGLVDDGNTYVYHKMD